MWLSHILLYQIFRDGSCAFIDTINQIGHIDVRIDGYCHRERLKNAPGFDKNHWPVK